MCHLNSEGRLVDLRFALELGCEWIALSFVQRPEDVVEARRLIGDRAHVLVKVEKPSALDRIDEIVAAADAVMVARGDLGVEMPPEEVPIAQKTIIRTCRDAGKPVIVATQMLESMVQAPVPTRAEVSDIATAVYDGVDAVMLSAETAAGAQGLGNGFVFLDTTAAIRSRGAFQIGMGLTPVKRYFSTPWISSIPSGRPRCEQTLTVRSRNREATAGSGSKI